MIFVNIHENHSKTVFCRFVFASWHFVYLAGDGEGGGGLFWDYFGTILYDLYIFLIKNMKIIKQVSFFASWQFLLPSRGWGGGRGTIIGILYISLV